ncbi:nucleotidyltransferase [Pseudomonas sp. PNP]|uniref:nucleotidyltransferase n=1 Tax=Pseudomonas sp. PNP TaxID=361819 RepID=UPI001AEC856E|nr:nucleotidyltransferase [Pseudomonas sp. PNP]MBP2840569.1 nucleotidyltransferase [Pseudomonas sp. PNP]
MKLETFTPVGPTDQSEQMLTQLVDALEIPASRYEAAERSYKSVGRWLDRPASRLAGHTTTIFPQGSFRLGTVIKPLNDAEDYDLDIVCEIQASKLDYTQEGLKGLLGLELEDYALSQSMAPPVEARRCWTLNYADGAQFHMDVLPALPDGVRQRQLIESLGHQNEWADHAMAITDREHVEYRRPSANWPGSNPKGYSKWFRSRMEEVFNAKRHGMALKEHASVEEIPEHRVRTPLQAAVKLLKRHRDIRFSEEPDIRPISIILTTLSAHAYQQEVTIGGALQGILTRMSEHIEIRNGVYWIENPTDPRENFADKWEASPEKKDAFFDWLSMARTDFEIAMRMDDIDDFIDALSPRMGRQLVEDAVTPSKASSGLNLSLARGRVSSKIRKILDAPHRKPLAWPDLARGSVHISEMTVTRNGYQPYSLGSDAAALPKNSSLVFHAQTSVVYPYKVYWQVVNTGEDASRRRALRGGFDEGVVQAGRLEKRESTLYSGSHSMECLIVKDGYCVARSGPFIVNIL